MERMSKIHIWIGNTKKSEEEYYKYFELDYSTEGDFDDPNYKVCQFCQDIGEKWYDEDFIGIIPLFEEPVEIRTLLDSISLKPESYQPVIDKCTELGITTANAVFYLTDAEIQIPKPYKKSYNDLVYIGLFDSSMS